MGDQGGAKTKRALGERGPDASGRQGSRFSASRVSPRKNVDSVIETGVSKASWPGG